MVQLNSHHGIASGANGELLLNHLVIEKVRQVLLVAGQLDIADVESFALSHRVADSAHRTSETGHHHAVHGSREAGVSKHGRDGLTVGSRRGEVT